MLEPLLQLRADWRQAVNVTISSNPAELTDVLDRTLDLLKENDQLDSDGLDMAVRIVCDSLKGIREDTVTILRDRLTTGEKDYLQAIGLDNESSLSSAFDSASDLAEALFAIANGTVPESAPEQEEAVRQKRVDETSLRKTLSQEQRKKQRKGKGGVIGILFNVLRVIAILALIAIAAYLFTHPNLFVHTTVVNETHNVTTTPST